MKHGDIVLISNKSQYDGVLIAEVDDNFLDLNGNLDERALSHVQIAKYPNHTMPARRIKIISDDIPRRELSEDLSKLLSNRHAIIQIRTDYHWREVFFLAYNNFIYKDKGFFVFNGRKFKDNILELNNANSLIAYTVALFLACRHGEVDNFYKLSFDEATAKYGNSEYFGLEPDFGIALKFESPGKWTVRASALLIMFTITVFAEGVELQTLPDDAVIEPLKDGNALSDDYISMALRHRSSSHRAEFEHRLKNSNDALGFNLESNPKLIFNMEPVVTKTE